MAQQGLGQVCVAVLAGHVQQRFARLVDRVDRAASVDKNVDQDACRNKIGVKSSARRSTECVRCLAWYLPTSRDWVAKTESSPSPARQKSGLIPTL